MTVSDNPMRITSVTPALAVTPCAEAIGFYIRAFGAVEAGPRMTGPDGLVGHAEILVGGSRVMLGDEWPGGPIQSPPTLQGSTAVLFIHCDDVEALWQRGVDAGAEVVYPLQMQFYGDKSGHLRDPFGHSWGLGQKVEDVDDEELAKRMAAFYESEVEG